ncbi:TRAP transporter small permease [Prauserella muralis]|nr:TRAP transporter small permease [Prauserella muralis]TWE22564.1 TRAP-type C4-dicarboxylate transport system permease small subunit [Prauserella muralis]
MNTLSRSVGRCVHGLAFAGSVAVAGMMLLVVADVALRSLLGQTIPGTIEYVSFWLMVPIAFAGFSLAKRRGDHIDVPLVVDRMPPGVRKACTVFSECLLLAFAVTVFWYGLFSALERLADGETTGASGTDIAPTRLVVPVAMAVLALQVADDLLRTFTSRKAGDDRAERDS